MQPVKIVLIAGLLGLSTLVNADCGQAKQLAAQAKQTGTAEEKEQLLARALKLCPDPIIGYRLGLQRLQMAQPKPKKALDAFEVALSKMKPGSSDKMDRLYTTILARQAEAYLLDGDLPNANTKIGMALDMPQAKQGMGWLWQIRAAVDDHPDFKFKTADTIARVVNGQRAVGISPKVDLYILFDTNKSQPNADGLKQTVELAKFLTNMKDNFKKALIIGHTDIRGDEKHNKELSDKRAAAVVALLEKQNSALKGKLKPKGKGERNPKYKGETAEDHRRNRRVEVRLQ